MAIAPVNTLSPQYSALGTPSAAKDKALKKTVDELVGTMFFSPVFKAMRESKLKGKFGHGGRGEEVFSAQLQDTLAKRMAHNAKLGINESLYRKFAQPA